MNYQIKAIYNSTRSAVLDPVYAYSVHARLSAEDREGKTDGFADYEVVSTDRPATHTFLTGVGSVILEPINANSK